MDRDYFQEIYDRFYTTVYRICLGYIRGDRSVVDDLVQEVFIRIWEKHDEFNERCALSTWIYRITVNCCLSELRKNKSYTQRNLSYEAPVGDSAEKQTSDQAVLMSCINSLTESERIIALLLLEGLSHDEIAQVVGCSNGNVRIKVYRIKQRLREIYLTKVSETYQ